MNLLWHGGVAGLWRGGVIAPGMAAHRHVDGCAQCEAQAAGVLVPGFDPPTPLNWVYATSDREYARYYASRALGGTLYRVRLEGDVEASVEDPFPTWRARRAIVEAVVETGVVLTMRQRENLWVRWGGTEAEFKRVIQSMGVAP